MVILGLPLGMAICRPPILTQRGRVTTEPSIVGIKYRAPKYVLHRLHSSAVQHGSATLLPSLTRGVFHDDNSLPRGRDGLRIPVFDQLRVCANHPTGRRSCTGRKNRSNGAHDKKGADRSVARMLEG